MMIARSNKKTWSPEEDARLIELVELHGANNWTVIADELNSGKRSKQCRERFHNHLQADIKKGGWTEDEERSIFALQAEYGNQWAKIAAHFPGRTDNSIKNRFNSMMRSMQHRQMKAVQKSLSQEECAASASTPSMASASTCSESSSAVLYSISAAAPAKRHPLVPTLALGKATTQLPAHLTIAVSSSRSSSSSSIKLSPYNFESSRSLMDMAQFAIDGDILETVRSTSSFDILRALIDNSEDESSEDEQDFDFLAENFIPFSARDYQEEGNQQVASIAPFSSRFDPDSAFAEVAGASATEEAILSPWWEERDSVFDLGSVMKRIEISPRQRTLSPHITPRSPFMLNMKKRRSCAY